VSLGDLKILKELGVTVNLDSLQQLETWFKIGACTAALRINAGAMSNDGRADRIGISPSGLPIAFEIAKRFGGTIQGLHVYVGTNFRSHKNMMPTLRKFFELFAGVDGIRYLNIGGGLGVDYSHSGESFDAVAFGEEVRQLS